MTTNSSNTIFVGTEVPAENSLSDRLAISMQRTLALYISRSRQMLSLDTHAPRCTCHSSAYTYGTCGVACQASKRRLEMQNTLVNHWRSKLFDLAAKVAEMEKDPEHMSDLQEYLEYYVDHPETTYDDYQAYRELSDLKHMHILDLENPSTMCSGLQEPAWDTYTAYVDQKMKETADLVLQAGEHDEREYWHPDPDFEFEDLVVESIEDPIIWFESAFGHLEEHDCAYFEYELNVCCGSMLSYVRELERTKYPQLETHLLRYVAVQRYFEKDDFRISLSTLIDRARTWEAARLSNLIMSRLERGLILPTEVGELETQAGFFGKRITEERVVDFTENLTLFVQDCSKATTPQDYIFCVMRYLKVQFGISIGQLAYKWMNDTVFDYVKEVQRCKEKLETQAGFGEFISTFKNVTSSSVWEKSLKLSILLGSLATYYFAQGDASKLTLKSFTTICTQVYDGMNATEMVGQVLEAIHIIYNKCIPCLFGKASFSTIFEGLGDGKQLDMDIAAFTTDGNRFIEGTLPSDVDVQTLLIKGAAVIHKLNDLIKTAHKRTDRDPLRRALVTIESLYQAALLKYSNAGVRAKPFTVSFHGVSGVGKTCLTFNLAITLQRALGISMGSKFIYRKDDGDTYDSALTVSHNTFLVDDLAHIKDQYITNIPNEVIIALSNNCPKFANKADLASKGVVPIKPEIVFITSNDQTLGSGIYSNYPEATLRRVEVHVETIVLPAYQDDAGMLREDVDPEEENYDCWLFNLTKFVTPQWVPLRNHEGVEMTGISFEQLCKYMIWHAKKHKLRQQRFVEGVETAHLKEFCKCGLMKVACKTCLTVPPLEMQAGEFGSKERSFTVVGLIKQLIVFILSYVATMCLLNPGWLRAHIDCMKARLLTEAERVTCNVAGALVRDYLRTVRDRILGEKKIIFTMLLTLVGAYGIHKMVAYDKTDVDNAWYRGYGCVLDEVGETQGSQESRPIAIKVSSLPDPWRKPELAPVPSNELAITTTGKQLTEVLQPRLCSVFVFDEPHKGHHAVTLPVMTNFWLVPWHVITLPYKYLRIEHAGVDKTNYCYTVYREGSYRRVGKTDYALVYLPNKGDQLDITRFFPSREKLLNRKLELRDTPALVSMLDRVVRKVGDQEVPTPHRFTAGVRVTSSSVKPAGVDHEYWGGSYMCPIETRTGLCGAVLYTPGPGPIIVGFHSAGVTGTRNARFCTLFKEDIESCIMEMTNPETPMMQGAETGDWALDFANMPFQHAIHKKSAFNYIDAAEVNIIGMHTAKPRRSTSQVRPTDFSDRVEELLGVPRKHGKPALMNHWYPGRIWSESCGNAKPVEMKYLDLAYKDYRTKVLDALAEIPDWQSEICVLDDVATVSGVDGVRGLDKMNLKASAGIPFQKNKVNFVEPTGTEEDGISNPLRLTPEMEEEKELMLKVLKEGKRVYTPHRANRKDEAIKIDKAKVRIFSGTSMPYLFLMRKYFLTISVFMQKHPEIFESAVGVNCYGPEWTRLHQYIARHGLQTIIAGDYEKYDQFVANMMTYAGFKILLEIAELAGFDKEDLLVMRGLATETCSPVYECEGSWYMFGSSTPSGHGLTVVINGIVNSLYARIAFYKMRPTGDILDFRHNVAFMSYGDDNIMSVSSTCPWFTHTAYQTALGVYGLNYTMADKGTESVPYISMDEATFLKRSWVKDERFTGFLCPLEEDSIHKMLHTMLVSKAVPVEQQLADILRSANQEYFMYPESTFRARNVVLQQIADEYKLNHYLPGERLPGYEDLCEWYTQMA